jgi:hypothetical protein
VRELAAAGILRSTYDPCRNRWKIRLPISKKAQRLLLAPKQTHKTHPTDLGDYYQRYGIRRIKGQRVELLSS